MPITLLDGILVGFTLVSAMLAMVRGFSREILSIASWAAALGYCNFFSKLFVHDNVIIITWNYHISLSYQGITII